MHGLQARLLEPIDRLPHALWGDGRGYKRTAALLEREREPDNDVPAVFDKLINPLVTLAPVASGRTGGLLRSDGWRAAVVR